MDLNLSAPNSQSFDDVLQKLKQSMRAARSGGWIDSDSGSELEIPLDHSPSSNDEGHPFRHGSVTRSINQQHLLYIKDGMDQPRGDVEDKSHPSSTLAPTPLWENSNSINPRASDLYHLKTRPLTTSSLKFHSVDPISVSYPQDSRISPLFDTLASPYVPRTPSTPVSVGTSAGSPYVRHHFKWEYLPPSTTGEVHPLAGTQPRFVESSSPPLKPTHDDPCSDWSKGFLPKEFISPIESAQARPASDARYNFENQVPISNSNFPSNMGNSYRSVSYSPTHGKSQSVLPQNFGAGYNRLPGLENVHKNTNSLKSGPLEPPQKPWLIGAPPQELKSHSQTLLNPASVSSVPFSLAPAAPIRLSAPEGDSQLKSSAQKGISRSPSREINLPITPRESNCVTTHATLSTSSSSVSLKELSQEQDKEAIRARLMGSSSIDSFQTKLHNFNKPLGITSAPSDGDHSAQLSNLPSLFQQMRFSNTTQPITLSQGRVQSIAESPLRSISATYPVNHTYCAPIFYSSHPHGKQTSFGVPSSATSSPNNLSQMAQLTPRTPITPIGYGLNTHLQTPSSGMPYPPTPSVNKPPFVPVIVPAVSGIGGAVGTPLPGQVQPEEVRKSVKTQPPVVNTGNSGAMIPQPGDWMCICGFVNWRRRKVCMRCFPFADGNDSVGAMMALNAQRAALLAAGIPVTKDHSSSTSAISNSSPTLFQSSETPSYPEMGKQIADQKVKFNRTSSSPEPVFNYGRLVEPTGVFTSQAQGMTMNPFDKPSPLGPISPTHGKNPHHSSNEKINDRYPNELSAKPLNRDVHVHSPIGRSDKSSKVLRARLVAPGEDQNTERNDWEESTSKSPRPRSFSMGAKSAWDSNAEIRQVGVPESQDTINSNKPEHIPIGKEQNGILGSKEVVGSQALNSRLVPDRLQELNTINNSGTNVNRQRTITSPASSWQAIKVLWQ